MSGHTPGPWYLESGRTARIDHLSVCHEDRHTPGAATGVIARVTCRVSWMEEQQANARLIAAAPDLLEALQIVRAGFDKRSLGISAYGYKTVVDAIEKATKP